MSSGFVLTQVWGLIQAVPAPPPISVPSPNSFSVKAQPLPAGIPGKGTITFYKLVVVAIAIAIIVAAPYAWILALLVGLPGWVMAENAGSTERAAETKKRRSALELAKHEYDRLVVRTKKEAGPEGFNARKAGLAKLRAELEDLPRAEKAEIDRLHATAHERQKQKFLETCFVDKANIPGVGPARKAALHSFGIETAADVTKSQVMQVRGFGESLTRAVLDWKASCERRFRFNPAAAVSDADRNAVRANYATKRVALERSLAAAPAQLRQFRQKSEAQLASLKPQVEVAAKKLAQAQADYSLLG
jgi:DNA-binding helix-hairpin-helix protein with protein kinase domain